MRRRCSPCWIGLWLLAGCYNPAFTSGQFKCDFDGAVCPGGFFCDFVSGTCVNEALLDLAMPDQAMSLRLDLAMKMRPDLAMKPPSADLAMPPPDLAGQCVQVSSDNSVLA